MKFFLACLIILAVSMLLLAVFGLGGLYFGAVNLFDLMMQLTRKQLTDYSRPEAGS